MKIHGYFVLSLLLVVLLAVAAGCTTPQPTTAAPTRAPATAPPVQQTAAPQAPAATAPQNTNVFPISIRVHYNDLACVNVGDYLGVTYLYPDDRLTLHAENPGPGTINENILFVDENDQLALRQAKPQWDQVKKGWSYPSVVPEVQFNDITTPVEKTFTIKAQHKYYICADDRKEAGSQDVTYIVPVTVTRL